MVLGYINNDKSIFANVDILLLNCGLHDIQKNSDSMDYQVDPADYEKNLNEIMDVFCEFDIKVIWVRTTPVDEKLHLEKKGGSFLRFEEDVEKYNRIADTIMNKRNIEMLDLNGFTKNIKDDLYLDGVHFKEEIRKLQAAYIAGYLKSSY